MKIKKIHPYIYIILTFLIVVFIGTFLLMLPISSKSDRTFNFIESFYLASSCICGGGLSLIDLKSNLSIFAFVVVYLLIEIGGLSIITIAVFFFSIIGAKIDVNNRFLLKEALNQNTVGGIVGLVKKIILISFIVQISCALINLIPLMKYYDNNFFKAFFISLFHSASSFNTAGFDIFEDSMIYFKDDIILNVTTILMIYLGGIGFVVIVDVVKKRRWKKFSLHSKITLISSIIIAIIGFILLTIFTKNITPLQALFTTISSMSCGYQTFDMTSLKDNPISYLVVLFLMFVGGSPCSTAGGIKTTTVAVLLISLFNYFKGKKGKIFYRRFFEEQIFKAFVLNTFAIIVVFLNVFIILLSQPELGISDVLFEVVSCFSTTGFTIGVTAKLNNFNCMLMALLMLFGRIGPLTVIGVINKNWLNSKKEDIKYVEEGVIIG